jgi:uncharacterized phage-associated protein
MQLPFSEVKATQAAGRFLELAGGTLNYMVLIKLMYLLDRAAMFKWARPVTFDEYYSMKNGPVLSEVHDLITEQRPPHENAYWSEHISAPSGYSISLNSPAGEDSLSEAEEELIQSVFEQYKSYISKPFELVDLLHKTLPEWTEITSGRVPLSHRDILKAALRSDAEVDAIEQELDSLGADYRTLLVR